jgi:hypothetical protein
MNSIWFLIIVTVSASGEVTSDLQVPATSKENTEQLCNYWGQKNADEIAAKINNKNVKVFWRCQDVSTTDIVKVLQ